MKRRAVAFSNSEMNDGYAFCREQGPAWKRTRPKHDHVIETLNKQYPLSFQIVGGDDVQEAEELLDKIKRILRSSRDAIFDATSGNANVSLEYGIAEERGMPRAIYLCGHAASRRRDNNAPIIADLAGKARNQYKTEKQLQSLLSAFAKQHAYTRRFVDGMRSSRVGMGKGAKKRFRALALKVIHALDGRETRGRIEVVNEVLNGSVRYREEEVDSAIKKLHKAKLLRCTRGRYSSVRIL